MSDKSVPEALQNCVANSTLLIGDNYIFLIITIIFYYVVQHSKYLIDKPNNNKCDKLINRGLYDNFISSFVYWVISFVIFIFIKYNGLSTINYFVWKKESLNLDILLINKGIDWNSILKDRFKFLSQNLLSLSISCLNVFYTIVLFYVLYKLITTYIELLECEKPECIASELCGRNNKAEYYYKGDCLDKNFNNVNVLSSKNASKSILTQDLLGNLTNVYNNYWKETIRVITGFICLGLAVISYILLPLIYKYSHKEFVEFIPFTCFIVFLAMNIWILIDNLTDKPEPINGKNTGETAKTTSKTTGSVTTTLMDDFDEATKGASNLAAEASSSSEQSFSNISKETSNLASEASNEASGLASEASNEASGLASEASNEVGQSTVNNVSNKTSNNVSNKTSNNNK